MAISSPFLSNAPSPVIIFMAIPVFCDVFDTAIHQSNLTKTNKFVLVRVKASEYLFILCNFISGYNFSHYSLFLSFFEFVCDSMKEICFRSTRFTITKCGFYLHHFQVATTYDVNLDGHLLLGVLRHTSGVRIGLSN